LRYYLHELRDGEGSLVFYKSWEAQIAFEIHSVAPHMMACREKTKKLLEKPAEVSVWAAVEVMRQPRVLTLCRLST